eukprot:TRINITY_DN67521_c0_g1_i3.p1 TRINITY_DN67521_c0_g1~~TRINITY_DN67521_c0_g1_i3.p1  ORF type:complete len:463 (-),score=231.07 TRINITY_DN67521_c0_g1_i3:859-2247(-)
MAIVRLVNGVTDVLQRSYYARSVLSLAAEVNMPRELVDVRHASTHGELPSHRTLEDAARAALQWLREYYWEPQAARLSRDNERIVTLLQNVKDKMKSKTGSVEQSVSDLTTFVSSSNVRSLLVTALLDRRDNPTLVKTPKNAKVSPTPSNVDKVFRKLVDSWQPFLEALPFPSFWPSLLKQAVDDLNALASASSHSDLWAAHVLTRWCVFVIESAIKSPSSNEVGDDILSLTNDDDDDDDDDENDDKEEHGQKQSAASTAHLRQLVLSDRTVFMDVLEACMQRPSQWTNRIAQLLCSTSWFNVHVDEASRATVQRLVSIHATLASNSLPAQPLVASTSSTSSTGASAGELAQQISALRRRLSLSTKLKQSDKPFVPVQSWKARPIGEASSHADLQLRAGEFATLRDSSNHKDDDEEDDDEVDDDDTAVHSAKRQRVSGSGSYVALSTRDVATLKHKLASMFE